MKLWGFGRTPIYDSLLTKRFMDSIRQLNIIVDIAFNKRGKCVFVNHSICNICSASFPNIAMDQHCCSICGS